MAPTPIVDAPWKRHPALFRAVEEGDPAWNAYVTACNHYLGRQLLVYENWPQRKWTTLGYAEKVFSDMNA